MFSFLYQFLICNQQVHLPGIGTFIVEITPGKTDIINKVVLPPEYSYRFERKSREDAAKNFFTWLALQSNTTERDAVKDLNEFSFEIKKLIQSGKQVIWKGVGILHPGEKEEIDFTPEKKHFVFEVPVAAEKIIRQNVQHVMLVGDKQTTSSRMTEILAQTPTVTTSSFAPAWWAIAIVLSFAAIMLMGWHFSEHGFGVTSTGTTKKINTITPAATYKQVQ